MKEIHMCAYVMLGKAPHGCHGLMVKLFNFREIEMGYINYIICRILFWYEKRWSYTRQKNADLTGKKWTNISKLLETIFVFWIGQK